jgi:hypothetical protein
LSPKIFSPASVERFSRPARAAETTRGYDPGRWRELRDVYAERFGPETVRTGTAQERKDEHGAA